MAKSESNLNKQLLSLTPDTLIELYEIDFSNLQMNFEMLSDQHGINMGADAIYRFCPMINSTNPIFWQGNGYQPLPIEMEGFEHQADGRLPRPKLKVANPEGLLSVIVHSNNDFANCKVTRKRTYARFLDDENFQNRNLNADGKNPFGASDPDSHYPDDVFFINRKVSENKEFIEFELVSALELEGAEVPARIMLSNYCPWKYRCSVGCGYKGLPIRSYKGKDLTEEIEFLPKKLGAGNTAAYKIPHWKSYGGARQGGSAGNVKGYDSGEVIKIDPKHHTDPAAMVFVCIKTHYSAKDHHPLLDSEIWIKDECGKTIDDCKARFGDANKFNLSKESGLPFGGFPSTERYEFD